MNKKPTVTERYILLSVPSNQIKLSSEEMQSEKEGEVRVIGNLVEHYKLGDKVLFNENKAIKIEYFKPNIYWKIREDLVTCGISEDDSI